MFNCPYCTRQGAELVDHNQEKCKLELISVLGPKVAAFCFEMIEIQESILEQVKEIINEPV